MKKIINIAFIFICFFIFEAKAITDKEAYDFVVEIGNQAIKILKIPAHKTTAHYVKNIISFEY